MNKTQPFLALALLSLFLLGTAAAETQKIALMPLKVHADKDLSYLQQGLVEMFSSRLTGEGLSVIKSTKVSTGNVGEARALGAELGTDYVLFGSLTVFGESVSIDVRVVRLADEEPPSAFFRQTASMGDVIPQVNEMATEIGRKLTGKTPPPSAAPPPEPTPQQATATPTPPEKKPIATKRFWKSRNFKMEIVGLTGGDMTGDGRDEVAFISEKSLHIYRYERKHFVKLKEVEAENLTRFLSVDTGDLNENGRDELFISCLNASTEKLQSIVLEWDGQGFQIIANEQPWYLRTVRSEKDKPLLLGQKIGFKTPYLPGIYQLVWQGRDLVQQEKISLQSDSMVFGVGMGRLMEKDQAVYMHYNSDNIIHITQPDGERIWKGEEAIGGIELFLDQQPAGGQSEKKRFYFYPRILSADINDDGLEEVIVAKNEEVAWGTFNRYRRYGKSRVEALFWDGLGLAQLAGTKGINDYISDFYFCDLDHDGTKELLAAVVLDRKSLLSGGKSAVIAYKKIAFED